MAVDLTPRKSSARSRAALLETFAPNVDGNIQAQDFQDLIASTVPDESTYGGDFWVEPSSYLVQGQRERALLSHTSVAIPIASQMGGAARGWIEEKQHIDSGAAFGNVLYMTLSGTWNIASPSTAAEGPVFAVALGDYASTTSIGVVLRRGVIYHTKWFSRLQSKVGRPVWLLSAGSISVTAYAAIETLSLTEAWVIGFVERPFNPLSYDGTSVMITNPLGHGVWRFEPMWGLLEAK